MKKRPLRTDNNSFEFVLIKIVEKNSVESNINSFDFVLNKVAEIQSVNSENNFLILFYIEI